MKISKKGQLYFKRMLVTYCKLEQCYVTKTSPARKQGEYWKF